MAAEPPWAKFPSVQSSPPVAVMAPTTKLVVVSLLVKGRANAATPEVPPSAVPAVEVIAIDGFVVS